MVVSLAGVQLRDALRVYPGEEQAYVAYGRVLQGQARVAIAKDDNNGTPRVFHPTTNNTHDMARYVGAKTLLRTAVDNFENASFQGTIQSIYYCT